MGRLAGVDEDMGLLAQVFDLGVELGNAVLQIRDQEVWCRCGELGGLELVFGLGSEFVESGNGVRTGAAGQDRGIRVFPGLGGRALLWLTSILVLFMF